MIRVDRIAIEKKDIEGLPSEDRFMFILSGHAINHLGMWLKLLTLSHSDISKHSTVEELRAAQSHMILRNLFTLIHEAWSWLEKEQTRKHIETEYLPHFVRGDADSYSSFQERMKTFKVLKTIRNQFSSHFPSRSQVETAFSAAPADWDWSAYTTEYMLNEFWFSSELTIGHGAISLAGGKTPKDSLKIILVECMEITNSLQDVLGAIMKVIMDVHWGGPKQISTFKVPGYPQGKWASLPFYVKPRALRTRD